MSPFSLSSSIDNMVKRFFPAKKKKRLIVFNVETTNLASLNRAADQASEIQHCSVSKNFKKTNLTAICVYDFSNNSYIFFDDENYRSFEDLIAHGTSLSVSIQFRVVSGLFWKTGASPSPRRNILIYSLKSCGRRDIYRRIAHRNRNLSVYAHAAPQIS